MLDHVKEPEKAFLFGYTRRGKKEKRADEYRIVILCLTFSSAMKVGYKFILIIFHIFLENELNHCR